MDGSIDEDLAWLYCFQCSPKGCSAGLPRTCSNSTEEYLHFYMRCELIKHCWVCAGSIPNIPESSVPKLEQYVVVRRNTPGPDVEDDHSQTI